MPSVEKQPPRGRLLQVVKNLAARVKQLENGGLYIPCYTQDPAASDNRSNIWVLSDGRLRLRQRDGSIVEYAPVGSPGSSNSANPPIITYPGQTQPQVITLSAALSATYNGSGVLQSGDPTMKYGNLDGAGPYKSFWSFDMTGVTIGNPCTRVELFIQNQATFNTYPIPVSLGTQAFNPHGQISFPGTQPAVLNQGFAKPTLGQADGHWFDIDPLLVVPMLRAGTMYGFAIDQGTDVNTWGEASGAQDAGLPPQMRVTYYA